MINIKNDLVGYTLRTARTKFGTGHRISLVNFASKQVFMRRLRSLLFYQSARLIWSTLVLITIRVVGVRFVKFLLVFIDADRTGLNFVDVRPFCTKVVDCTFFVNVNLKVKIEQLRLERKEDETVLYCSSAMHNNIILFTFFSLLSCCICDVISKPTI